jgi:hypothetical protein
MRDSAVFTVAYNGPALKDGSMDVRELAPALLALGDLISETNRIINDDTSKIQVRIKADFQVGSFEINIEIFRTLAEQIGIFIGQHTDVKNLLETLGLISSISGITVLGLFKIIKGRKIAKAKLRDDHRIEIHYTDNSETTIVEQNVYNVFVSLKVQDSVQDLLKPLQSDGVTEFFTFDNPEQRAVHVTQDEVQYYTTPPHREEDQNNKTVTTHEGAYKVITSHFEGNYKWRITNGEDRLTAYLKDEKFLEKIAQNEVSIAKEDVFTLLIKTTRWTDSTGEPKAENEIIEVKKQIKRPNQMQIPFED